MKPALADMYITLKRGLEELIQMKVRVDHFFQFKSQMNMNFWRCSVSGLFLDPKFFLYPHMHANTHTVHVKSTNFIS